jgi:hypothetical protein
MMQPNVEYQRDGFAAGALRRLRGRGLKVIAKEVLAFGVAFAVSLAISVAVVELIRGLILSEQQIATRHSPVIAELGKR